MTTRQANDKHCSSNASGNDPDKAEQLPTWAVAMSNSHQSKNDEHFAAERSYWAAQQRHQAQTTGVALLALFAAGASAWYTLQQVSVAEDQERKACAPISLVFLTTLALIAVMGTLTLDLL